MPVVPYDEPEIGPGDRIIRRINPKEHVVWDDNRQRWRVSSKAFNKSSTLTGGMSVDIEALILKDGTVDPKIFVTTPVYTASVAFFACDIRKLDLMVGYDPLHGVEGIPDNPYHGEVWLKTMKKKFSDSLRQSLLNAAQWYVPLMNIDLS